MEFNPNQQLNPKKSLIHSFPGGIRGRIGRVEVTKFMGWDKGSAIGRAKAVEFIHKQGKEFILHFPWAGRDSAIPRRPEPHHR